MAQEAVFTSCAFPFFVVCCKTYSFRCFPILRLMPYSTEKYKKINSAFNALPWENSPEAILKMLKYTISIETIHGEPGEIALGMSKVGGRPHLPKSVAWPEAEGKPMAFLGQVNFAELVLLDHEGLFPKKGIVYFFLEANDNELPYDIHERSQVIFTPEAENLERRLYPDKLPEYARFQICDLRFRESYTLPSLADPRIAALQLSEKDIQLLGHFNEEVAKVTGRSLLSDDWILGEPYALQHDVFEEWVKWGGGKPEEYELLLQVGFMDYNTNLFDFGDAGVAYWGIRKEDLQNQAFEKTVLTCQGT